LWILLIVSIRNYKQGLKAELTGRLEAALAQEKGNESTLRLTKAMHLAKERQNAAINSGKSPAGCSLYASSEGETVNVEELRSALPLQYNLRYRTFRSDALHYLKVLQTQLEEDHPLTNIFIYHVFYSLNVEISWYLLSLGVAVNNYEVFGESIPVFDDGMPLKPDRGLEELHN
jgi:hypothetical protein